MKQIKQTYLILLIVLSLFSLALYSTYAMFTTEINTNNIVSIDTSISIDTNIDEYKVITIDSNSYKIMNLIVNNSKQEELYYGVWHEILSGNDYNIKAYKIDTSPSQTVDIIKTAEQKQISIVLINDTNKKATLKIGISTALNTSLNLPKEKILITNEISNNNIKNQTAAEYLTSLYTEDDLEMYYYDNENLLYYGENPNNYLILNDELWRIIGIYNKQLKLIKEESIGNFIYDVENKELANSKINQLLNNLYYSSKKGECYKNEKVEECDFLDKGLKKEITEKISTQKIENEIISISTIENISTTPILTETAFETNVTLLSLKDYQKSLNCKKECQESWITKKNTLLSTQNIIENTINVISIKDKKIKIDNPINSSIEIRPVILLKEDISIIRGNGTKSTPYILK